MAKIISKDDLVVLHQDGTFSLDPKGTGVMNHMGIVNPPHDAAFLRVDDLWPENQTALRRIVVDTYDNALRNIESLSAGYQAFFGVYMLDAIAMERTLLGIRKGIGFYDETQGKIVRDPIETMDCFLIEAANGEMGALYKWAKIHFPKPTDEEQTVCVEKAIDHTAAKLQAIFPHRESAEFRSIPQNENGWQIFKTWIETGAQAVLSDPDRFIESMRTYVCESRLGKLELSQKGKFDAQSLVMVCKQGKDARLGSLMKAMLFCDDSIIAISNSTSIVDLVPQYKGNPMGGGMDTRANPLLPSIIFPGRRGGTKFSYSADELYGVPNFYPSDHPIQLQNLPRGPEAVIEEYLHFALNKIYKNDSLPYRADDDNAMNAYTAALNREHNLLQRIAMYDPTYQKGADTISETLQTEAIVKVMTKMFLEGADAARKKYPHMVTDIENRILPDAKAKVLEMGQPWFEKVSKQR